jgi:hypothetical protein
MTEIMVEPPVRRPYPLMHDAGFPWGLRCAECHRTILDGQPYAEVPDAVSDSGALSSLLKCVYC